MFFHEDTLRLYGMMRFMEGRNCRIWCRLEIIYIPRVLSNFVPSPDWESILVGDTMYTQSVMCQQVGSDLWQLFPGFSGYGLHRSDLLFPSSEEMGTWGLCRLQKATHAAFSPGMHSEEVNSPRFIQQLSPTWCSKNVLIIGSHRIYPAWPLVSSSGNHGPRRLEGTMLEESAKSYWYEPIKTCRKLYSLLATSELCWEPGSHNK